MGRGPAWLVACHMEIKGQCSYALPLVPNDALLQIQFPKYLKKYPSIISHTSFAF